MVGHVDIIIVLLRCFADKIFFSADLSKAVRLLRFFIVFHVDSCRHGAHDKTVYLLSVGVKEKKERTR